MTFNVGDFMWSIITILINLTQKLYDAINYEVSIKWLKNALKLIGVSLDIGDTISLIGIIATLGAGALIIIIIYNIFK